MAVLYAHVLCRSSSLERQLNHTSTNACPRAIQTCSTTYTTSLFKRPFVHLDEKQMWPFLHWGCPFSTRQCCQWDFKEWCYSRWAHSRLQSADLWTTGIRVTKCEEGLVAGVWSRRRRSVLGCWTYSHQDGLHFSEIAKLKTPGAPFWQAGSTTLPSKYQQYSFILWPEATDKSSGPILNVQDVLLSTEDVCAKRKNHIWPEEGCAHHESLFAQQNWMEEYCMEIKAGNFMQPSSQ